MVGNNRSNGLEAHISLKVARWWEGGLMGVEMGKIGGGLKIHGVLGLRKQKEV